MNLDMLYWIIGGIIITTFGIGMIWEMFFKHKKGEEK